MSKLNYVNVEIGTDSSYRESNGNTLPLVQVPFGMQAYTIQTDGDKGGWFYNPRVNYAEGIRITNQPSPWLGDYGQVIMMPQSNKAYIDNGGRHSSVKNKVLNPNYINLHFSRYQTNMELTPTTRGAKIKVSYEKENTDNLFLIKCYQNEGTISVEGNTVKVISKSIPNVQYSENFRKFHIFEFDCKIVEYQLYCNNDKTDKNTCEEISIVVKLEKDQVCINQASSYISFHQAESNLLRELKNRTFQDIKDESEKLWTNALTTIEIDDTEEKKRIFYSNLYRCFLYPHVMHELDENNNPVHYSFYLKEVQQGVMYTDNGFWDTYRTTFPLLRNLVPDTYKEIIKSLLNSYQQSGWLPRWMAPFERGIMPSTLTDSVIAEAIVCDMIEKEDIKIAIEALLKDGEGFSDNELHGRRYLKEYIEYGYIPLECGHETVSMTLDNAYSDYAIYLALDKVGNSKASEYLNRSKNYQNLFNKDTLFLERRSKNGDFDQTFDPKEWGIDFCESSGWSNNFTAVHDINGFKSLFKNEDAFLNRLGEVFSVTPHYEVGRYNFEIHEMTEVAKCNLGYFGISNQPSFHLPFIFAAIDREERTAEILKETQKYFTAKNDGFPGDEDNGSLSAWYVFSQIGKYPLIPASGEFVSFPVLAKDVKFKNKDAFFEK